MADTADQVGAASQILTERLCLRAPTYDDASALHVAFSDPVACRFLPQRISRSVHETRYWMTGAFGFNNPDLRCFIIAPRTRPERAIGLIQSASNAELGGLLVRSAWSQGLMTEALVGFLRQVTQRVWCICDAEHKSVERVLARHQILPTARLAKHRVHPQISNEPRDCILYKQV